MSSPDFGPYKSPNMIGIGAFGKVYLVKKDDIKYAIKRIDMSKLMHKELLKKYFDYEVKI